MAADTTFPGQIFLSGVAICSGASSKNEQQTAIEATEPTNAILDSIWKWDGVLELKIPGNSVGYNQDLTVTFGKRLWNLLNRVSYDSCVP